MEEKTEIFISGGAELERAGKFINPTVTDLRISDANLLSRFKPRYYAFITQCQYCTFGPCDLSKNRRGACGMHLNLQMAKEALVTAIVGASSYIARACELNNNIIKKHTYIAELNLKNKNLTTTFINLLCGYEPKTVGELKKALRYANEEIVHLFSATHMGQEASDFDFNSKIFHAGIMCLLGMEIYEILKKFSNNDEGSKKFDIGFGAVDRNKGVVLVIGDYVTNSATIFNSKADFEIIHLGSGAFDFNAKIGGNSALELIYERTGLVDVIVIGAGNVRTDVIETSKKLGIPVIAISEINMAGLVDLSNLSADKIFKKIMSGEISGCYIKDSEKQANVIEMLVMSKRNLKIDINMKATCECINCGLCKKACPVNVDSRLIIQSINKIFNKPESEESILNDKITEQAKECNECGNCATICPSDIQISDLIIAIKEGREIKAKEIGVLRKCTMCGLCQEKCPKKINIKEIVRIERKRRNIIEDIKFLTKEEILNVLEKCIFCGRCESQCPKKIPIASIFAEIYKEKFINKKASVTLSHDIFITKDAQTLLVLGDANFPNGSEELAEILGEFLNRNFLVFTAGDVTISMHSHPSSIFNLTNLGPLSASVHLIEKIVEMASKDMNKNSVGNFDEIATYIANNVSVVVLFWGATTQENFAVAQGLMRLGIPVIFGRQGIKYRRELRGDVYIDYSKDDYNGSYNEILKKISPKNFAFPHLCIAAKTKEEAMLLIPKMVFRNSDSEEVRAKKISNYIEIYRKYDKTKEIPDDIKNFVRNEKDIPEKYRSSIQKSMLFLYK